MCPYMCPYMCVLIYVSLHVCPYMCPYMCVLTFQLKALACALALEKKCVSLPSEGKKKGPRMSLLSRGKGLAHWYVLN